MSEEPDPKRQKVLALQVENAEIEEKVNVCGLEFGPDTRMVRVFVELETKDGGSNKINWKPKEFTVTFNGNVRGDIEVQRGQVTVNGDVNGRVGIGSGVCTVTGNIESQVIQGNATMHF